MQIPSARTVSTLILLGLLLACGGGRERAEAPQSQPLARLHSPATARAPAEDCAGSTPRHAGPVGLRQVGEHCLRSFEPLLPAAAPSGPQRRTAATAPMTVNELFDWAELRYSNFFPSKQSTRSLSPYQYRYYPESGNHVAVTASDGKVWVQGPMSDGALLYVGQMADFVCLVKPLTEGCAPPKTCNAPASWVVAGNTCNPGQGQPSTLTEGSQYTFVDPTPPATGTATFACENGALVQRAGARCEVPPPNACNTSDLSWTVSGVQCKANANEPTQLPWGESHTFLASSTTIGSITLRCDIGSLTQVSPPTCASTVPVFCTSTSPSWTVDGATCNAEDLVPLLAEGSTYKFKDSLGETTGTASYVCRSGSLEPLGDAECKQIPHMRDSFGGDGGASDGGASGDGSAGDGAPIVGGQVRVEDMNGRTAFATTDSQGYYRVKLTGMVPPLVLSVTRSDGVVRRSFSTQALRINGYIFMGITGLTDKMASDIARASGQSGAAGLTPAMLAANPSAITAALEALRNDPVVSNALTIAGVNPSSFDPLYTPFRLDGTGYDKALDLLVVTVDASGATVVKSVDCPAPSSWTVGNLTCVPDPSDPLIVPNDRSVVFHDTRAPNTGTAAFSCLKAVLYGPILPSCK
ncbi:hypothetical protein [Inhella proteolytica]|uniref:Uncharacterized protein n=1 Tax=Inhella proteolytica TaxID=2795029 RepID=A0A931JAB7_9BURK|nr:hypothetical protein [Inhella proteolytica]MBH9579307.1 hypothetical protein [Inhella proteolytica]